MRVVVVSLLLTGAARADSSLAILKDRCMDALEDIIPAPHRPWRRVDVLIESEIDRVKLPKWQADLVKRIWKDETERGYKHFRFAPTPTWRGIVSLPPAGDNYLFDVTRAVQDIAASQHLPPAQRYVALPAKLMLTHAARYPYNDFLLVAGIAAGGHVISKFGLMYPDPLVTEVNPGDFKDDEVAVLVQWGQKNGDKAMGLAARRMDALHQQAPDRFLKMDLSNEALSVPDLGHMFLRENYARLQGKKIRKVIVISHGSAGHIYRSNKGVSVAELSPYLGSLKRYLSPQTEVIFNGCMVAGNEDGRKALRDFATDFLPKGGRVVASRPITTMTPDADGMGRALETAPWFLVPVLGPYLGESSMAGTQQLSSREYPEVDRILLPARFDYQVK